MKFLATLTKHAPKLLTIGAIAGTITTGVLSFKAGVKSSDDIKQMKEDLARSETREEKRFIVVDGFKHIIPNLVPAGVAGLLSVACSAGSLKISDVHLKNITKVAEAAIGSRSALYDAIKDKYGEPAANKLMAKSSASKIELKPEDRRYIIDTGGDTRCCIDFFNVDFISTRQDVDLALRHLACQCDQENGVTGTDLLHLLGIYDNIGAADCICWHTGHLTKDNEGYPKLPIEVTTIERDGQPCYNIYFIDYALRRY